MSGLAWLIVVPIYLFIAWIVDRKFGIDTFASIFINWLILEAKSLIDKIKERITNVK